MNYQVEKVNYKIVNYLLSAEALIELMNPSKTAFSNVFKTKSALIKESFLIDIINDLKDESDYEILNKACLIIDKMFFKDNSRKCFTSEALIKMLSFEGSSEATKDQKYMYERVIQPHYKIVFDIRTMSGLFNQISLFANKAAEPACRFINSIYVSMIKEHDKFTSAEMFYDLLNLYVEFVFENVYPNAKEKDVLDSMKYISIHCFLRKAIEYIENKEIEFELKKVENQ